MSTTADLVAEWPAMLALALIFAGGMALIASGKRAQADLLLQRVKLVRPTAGDDGRRIVRLPATLSQTARRPNQGLSEAAERQVIRELAAVGFPVASALISFLIIRALLGAMLAIVIFVWMRHAGFLAAVPAAQLLFGAIGAMAGWYLPSLYISRRLKRRAKAVNSGLPDALELLVVCIEAGLSLEDSLARVVSELERAQPEIADELALTLADLKILPSRDQAFANFAQRADLPSVRAVVNTLVQTLRYGTPLAQSLRVAASEMRNDYLLKLEEQANRLPALMTLPVVVFMMPTIFLVAGGPAALRLFDAFSVLPR